MKFSLEIGPPCSLRAIDKLPPPSPSDGERVRTFNSSLEWGLLIAFSFIETTEVVDDKQVDVLHMVNEIEIH